MKRKAILCIVMTIALLTSVLAGCSANRLAGRVGGHEVHVYQLENLFKQYESYASTYYGYDITTEEGLNGYQDYLLDALLNSEAQVYMAEQAGVELTDEEKAEAKKNAEAAFDEFYQQHLDAAKQAGAADANAYANQLLTDTLAASKTTLSKYKKTLLKAEEDSIRVNKYQDQLFAQNMPTEEEIQAEYDALVEQQKATFDATPATYFTYAAYSQYGYMDPPVYRPAGLFYVRHILVAEQSEADLLLKRIQAGEDFEKLLEEYNTDPGMESADYADGYIVGEGADAQFQAEFVKAALALEAEGDVSPVVQTSNGYHIIKRMKNVEPGVIPMSDADHDSILATAKSEFIAAKVDEVMQQAERFPDNYRFIGRSGLVAATPELTADPAATAQPAADAASTEEPAPSSSPNS